MSNIERIEFIDNKAAQTNPEKFVSVTIDTARVFKSWKGSIYSFEWLDSDGKIKTTETLSDAESAKRAAVEKSIAENAKIEKPVLGIGMMDNIEIGSGRATFLTLADAGVKTMPVHIPKSCESDFKDFLTEV